MTVSIVIPAYNEAARIGQTLPIVLGYLERHDIAAEVIVVNDGSTDRTRDIALQIATLNPAVRVLDNERNLGKGASVKRGVLAALGGHILFMDADLSVPVAEIGPLLETMRRHDHPIVIGSRKMPGSRIVRRQPLIRETLGHAFTWLARMTLHREIVDFTCGFKAFRRDAAMTLFSLQRRSDWAFDAELLHLAGLLGIPVHQHPVEWHHHGGSRVRFPRDIWKTLKGLIDIRWHTRALVRRHDGISVGLAAAAMRQEDSGRVGPRAL
jgi:dolichyl-phosphate beta-glucosyltransferase